MFQFTDKKANIISLVLTLTCFTLAVVFLNFSGVVTMIGGFLFFFTLIAFPIFKYILQPKDISAKVEHKSILKQLRWLFRAIYLVIIFFIGLNLYNLYATAKNYEYPQPDKILTIKAGTNIRECPRTSCKITNHYPKLTRSFYPADFDTTPDWIEVKFWADNSRTVIKKGYVPRDSFVELSSNATNPVKNASNTTVKPKPPQKLSVPTPTDASSGPPVTLYTKTDVNIYKSASNTSEIIGQAQQYGYWEFPYTPTGDWYSVLTIDSKPGFVRATDLTTEKPKFPDHCSLTLSYRIGQTDDWFAKQGFSGNRLNDLMSYSEKLWEDALGKDIFTQDNNSPNVITFTIDPLGEGSANETGHYGRLYYDKAYPNGTVQNFHIKIFSELFTYATQPSLLYYGEPATQDKLNEAVIAKVIAHEFGHALGLDHLDLDKVEHKESIMIGGKSGGYATSYLPKLTNDDLKFLKDFCGTN